MPVCSGVMKRRFAHALSQRYAIPPGEIAPVLGVQEATYLRDLKRLGLRHDVENQPAELRPVDELMTLLLSELRTITRPDEATTPKMRLDALSSIARTLEKLDEMRARGDGGEKAGPTLTADEMCAVMQRLEDRIGELADVRAEELVRNRAGSAAGGSA